VGSRDARSKAVTAILLVLVVILASTTVYFSYAVADANARVSSIQKSVADLQYRNGELQRQLGVAQSRQNSTVADLNPVFIYETSNRSVVTIQGSRTVSVLTLFGSQNAVESVLGSGFVVDYSNSDYIVTNFHVVDSMVNVTVTFWNGDAYGAKVVGSDPYSDLAVLSTEASQSDLHPLDLTSSSSLMVGQPVVAIGNPFGLSGSVTFGIISQLGRTIQYQSISSTFTVADAIQFSAPINPGNSGGPLLDANGFVVGITSAAVTGSQGVGFAIPSDAILRELPSLIQAGKYSSHPYLGIQAVDMNYQLAQAMRTSTTYGVLIEATAPGGPADKATLKGGHQTVTIGSNQYILGGDIIVSVNGTRIVNYDALATYLEEYTVPGQTIQVGIIRSGNQIVVPLVVGSLPSQ
jgi:S1-C subfamily serine protease